VQNNWAWVINPFRLLLLWSENPPSLAKGRSPNCISRLYFLTQNQTAPLLKRRGELISPPPAGEDRGAYLPAGRFEIPNF